MGGGDHQGGGDGMTSRERVHAALEGRPVDRFPVTSLYHQLYRMDHFLELTGLPGWRVHEWLGSSPDRYVEWFAVMQELAPFELLQPHRAPSRAARERWEFVERDGHGWRHDKTTDEWQRLDVPTVSGHATDYHANETQLIRDEADVREQVKVATAEGMIADGINDYAEAVAERFGDEEFVLTGGVAGVFYTCSQYVGFMNLFSMIAENPGLLEYLNQRLLEQSIEQIRCHAAAGGDAIYIDDACTTSDMISVRHFEQFSLPYMRPMVEEAHRLGMKVILIYFGGIADRLEQIASLGADGLLFECSMKGYLNDVAQIAEQIGDRITLFGNTDPVGVLQDAGDVGLQAEIRRQVAAGRTARGFIMSTASPITPGTPLSRVQRFIELSKQESVQGE